GSHLSASARAVYDVRDFGARGDGRTLDTDAIHAAIAAAHAAGGGIVHFSPGTYLTKSIRLRSRIVFRLGIGAVLEAAAYAEHPFDAPEPELAPGAEKQSSPGHSHWHNSLIYGIDLDDIAILGPGRIFGRSLVRERVVPAGAGNKAIALRDCRNVLLRDFSILRGGHFAMLLSGIENLTLDHLKIDTQRDGINLDCCRNVRVSNCSINSPFDDGLCLKSSTGLGRPRLTENVTITNCQVSGYDVGTLLDGTCRREVDYTRPAPAGATGHLEFGPQEGSLAHRGGPTGRIKLGTESWGGFRNIAISNCVFEYCRGLALETVDGGVLEDVTVNNLTLRDVQNSPIFVRLGRRNRGLGTPPVAVVRRVTISNVVASNVDPRFACLLLGIPGHPIEDLTLSNIRILFRGGGTAADAARDLPELETGYPEPYQFGVTPAYGLFLRHARRVTLHAIDLQTDAPDARPALMLDDVADVRLSLVNAACVPGASLLRLKEVSGLTISQCAGLADATGIAAGARVRTAPARVFVVGDSISLDYGPSLERRLAPRFAYDRKRDDGTGTSVDLDDPKGANGGDSRMVLDYLRRRRERNPIAADILVLNCGLHDLRTDPATGAKRVPLPEYADNLRAILAEAAAMALPVAWVRITPVVDAIHNARCSKFRRFSADVDAYNRMADEIMLAAGVSLIDLHAFTQPYLPSALADHVHFAPALRDKQGAFIASHLMALIDAGPPPPADRSPA
ncbi:MAG TPA: glycosyl hydrolase family 28-related protein, partial [Opitutaceae bacterium]|nr:glycosyl hydrolase family 28-related protein [Opitutaceae bacterium]